jgi:hypothetical protein
MRITVEIEVDDEIEEHAIPSPEMMKVQSCGWRQCPRCGSLRFYHLKRIPVYDGPRQPGPYNISEDQSALALVMCATCHKFMAAQ